MQTTACSLDRCTPEEAGIPSKAISNFIDEINARGLGVHSFTLVRHGKIACQCFWKPYAPEFPHVMYSMSKSITSTAVGFAVSEGLISLEDKVSKFFPEYPVKGRNLDLTIRHLLTMRSDKNISVLANKGNSDWVKTYFNAPFKCPPDTKFDYISENTHMLSAIVTRVTGQTLVEYLYPRLFAPLGIEKPFWETDGAGVAVGGWGLYMQSEDLAKIFLVYLNKGMFQGQRILPEEWVEQASAYQTPTHAKGAVDNVCGYGYQFWRNHIPNSYRADGLFGQRCLLLPEYDALMVINSGQAEDYFIMDAFWAQFPQCFSDKPLPEAETNYQELQSKIAACHVPDLPAAPRNLATEQGLNGKTIQCYTNEFASVLSISITQMLYRKPGKINEMRFQFHPGHLSFTWKEKTEYNTIQAGMDGNYGISDIQLQGLHYTCYSKAAWQPDGALKLWIRPIQTAHVRQFTFRFFGNIVRVTNESTPSFPDLAVYDIAFLGNNILSRRNAKMVRGIVNAAGCPLVEPNFIGKIKA